MTLQDFHYLSNYVNILVNIGLFVALYLILHRRILGFEQSKMRSEILCSLLELLRFTSEEEEKQKLLKFTRACSIAQSSNAITYKEAFEFFRLEKDLRTESTEVRFSKAEVLMKKFSAKYGMILFQ